MGLTRSWQFVGEVGSWSYSLFDAQRKRLNRGLVRYLSANALPTGNCRVLEAGSGPGFGSSLFAGQGNVRLSVALDIDLDALREARRRDPTLPVVGADLHQLPFRPGSFNLVWSSSTVEHVNSPGDALAEMRRVVKDGGYLFIGVPYRFGPLGVQPWITETRFGKWLGPVFDEPQLRGMMIQHGLVPDATTTYFFKFFIGVVARKSTGERLPGLQSGEKHVAVTAARAP